MEIDFERIGRIKDAPDKAKPDDVTWLIARMGDCLQDNGELLKAARRARGIGIREAATLIEGASKRAHAAALVEPDETKRTKLDSGAVSMSLAAEIVRQYATDVQRQMDAAEMAGRA